MCNTPSQDDIRSTPSDKPRTSTRISISKSKKELVQRIGKDAVKTEELIEKFIAENDAGITSKSQLELTVSIPRFTRQEMFKLTDDWSFLDLSQYQPQQIGLKITGKRQVKRTEQFHIEWTGDVNSMYKNGWYTRDEVGGFQQDVVEFNANAYKKLNFLKHKK